MSYSITRSAHVELRVTDLDRSHEFYVKHLGLIEIHRERDRLYLGALQERDLYSLVLRKAESGGVGHMAMRLSDPDDLPRLADLYQSNGLPIRWLEPGEDFGQGRALRIQDPNGLPVEFFNTIEQREWKLQKFDEYRGAHIMNLDHLNSQVPEVQASYDWWTGPMGFYCSEYTVTEDPPDRLWAAWLHRKQNIHDLSLMTGIGPRLHHVGYWVADTASVLRACDILAAVGLRDCIERGPGRHGLSNAFFVYLRDPDGNRVELYTGDYLIPDPDFKPIRWSINDPRRQTFWGHIAPRSWFDEAMRLESPLTGELIQTRQPAMQDRPEFVI
jgi:3,4-dihydroxyphenylacetate 2,3-dioxygenase